MRIIIIVIIACMTQVITAVEEKSIDLDHGQHIEIDLKTGGDISIEGWDEPRCLVTYRIRGDRDDVRFDIGKTDTGVLIASEQKSRFGRSRGIDITLMVPFKSDLSIGTSGGDVQVVGVRGAIQGKSMGGNLEFSKLTGTLEFQTMGGNVILTDSEVDGFIKTMGGNITFRDVTGKLDAKTMGGNVIYDEVVLANDGRQPADEDVVRVETMGGNIKVGDAPYGAEMKTMGGNITLDSAGYFVQAETMGGNINIEQVDGRVFAHTKGGHVHVVMVSQLDLDDRSVDIESLGGDIYLSLPEDMSIDFDIVLKMSRRHVGQHEIISDFALERDKRQSGRQLVGLGQVNGGRHKVRIRTINSDIHIKAIK